GYLGLLGLVVALIALGSRFYSNSARNAAEANAGTASLGHHEIKAEQLPAPNTKEDANNPPRVIDQPTGAKLTVPAGFEITTFADGQFERPRGMALAPNGDVFVTDSAAGSVIVLRDSNKDGRADERFTFATDLLQPFGISFWRDYVYVGNTNAVVRFR